MSRIDTYFEMADCVVGQQYHAMGWRTIPAKYCVRYGTPGLAPILPSKLSYLAERIWQEGEDGTVVYIKNRIDHLVEVDLKEFMWIKLSAVKV